LDHASGFAQIPALRYDVYIEIKKRAL